MNDIQIDAQWIPRDANVRADLLSRFVDKDDWSLNCEIFALDFACIVQHLPAVNRMARVWHAFATVTGRHSCVCCCTLASFERGLSCIPRFGTSSAMLVLPEFHVSVMLPTLGGYMREVALFALCCSFLSMYLNAIILGLLERKSLLNLIISWMASLSQELLLQLIWVYSLPTTYLGTNIVTTFAKRQILLLAYLDVFYLAVPPK